MNIAQSRNIGAYIKNVLAFNYLQVTAGGGADGVAQNGRSVNRLNYLSCVVSVLVSAALASTETASVTIQLQDSADGSTGWANYKAATTIAIAALEGGDPNGQVEGDFNLSAAKQYVRSLITITMSASATDTADVMASFTFAGEHERPLN